MLPSISIIIPVYKVKQYIIKCIQSVIDQDYKGNIECILIDDKGEDGSIELCEDFIKNQISNVQFIILYNDINKKQSASRNAGMKIAKGDYIYFLDSDDWLDSSAISTMVNMLIKYPGCDIVQAGISRTQPEIFKWLDCISWKDKSIEYSNDKKWIIDTCAKRLGMIPMTPVSKLMKREMLEKNSLKFVEGIFHEDEVWLVLLAKYMTSIAFCHCNLYNYRIRTDSTTGGGNTKHFQDWKIVWLEIFKLLDNNFCPQSILNQIEGDTTRNFLGNKQKSIRRMLVFVKLKLIKYCNIKQQIHILLWIIKHCYQII